MSLCLFGKSSKQKQFENSLKNSGNSISWEMKRYSSENESIKDETSFPLSFGLDGAYDH